MPNHENFDFDKLTFAPQTTQNSHGGRRADIWYGTPDTQVKFQLGRDPHDTLRTPFGAEPAVRDDPTSGMVMKVEVEGDKLAFMQRFEKATSDAAHEHSQAYFNRPTPPSTFNTCIREQNGDRPNVLKLKIATGHRATIIKVGTLKDGKIEMVDGSVDDITPGSMVLPIIRVQGGMYFIQRTYGTSLVVDQLLVVKEGQSTTGPLNFILGDVEMVDAHEESGE